MYAYRDPTIWLKVSPSKSTMGSVGPDYVCPDCGRVGKGGYALDSLGYPICTIDEDGVESCLTKKIKAHRTAARKAQWELLKWIVLAPSSLLRIEDRPSTSSDSTAGAASSSNQLSSTSCNVGLTCSVTRQVLHSGELLERIDAFQPLWDRVQVAPI